MRDRQRRTIRSVSGSKRLGFNSASGLKVSGQGRVGGLRMFIASLVCQNHNPSTRQKQNYGLRRSESMGARYQNAACSEKAFDASVRLRPTTCSICHIVRTEYGDCV